MSHWPLLGPHRPGRPDGGSAGRTALPRIGDCRAIAGLSSQLFEIDSFHFVLFCLLLQLHPNIPIGNCSWGALAPGPLDF